MKTKLIALVAVSSILLQSCATVFSGHTAKIKVPQGTPENAKIYVDGTYKTDAPGVVEIPKSSIRNEVTLTVKADGKEQTTKVRRKVQAGWVILDILTGAVWLAVDFITGDIYKASPDKVDYNLQKQ